MGIWHRGDVVPVDKQPARLRRTPRRQKFPRRDAQKTKAQGLEAHVLRQGPDSSSATSFDAHQDTEEHDFIEYTAIVKLTPDEPGELPSEMRVVGAPVHFKYGPKPGASGCFRARLYHASVLPASAREHLKIAFFFKKAVKEARWKRPPQ